MNYLSTTILTALVCLYIVGLRVNAAEEKPAAKVGDAAPKFEAQDDKGQTWKSSEVVGKKILVLYFYPADFTGGCTKQACAFRDDFKKLEEKGVVVVGVSGDSAKTHAAFKKEHNLPFTLLADEKGELAKMFGVPTKDGGVAKFKDEEYKRGVTASRWTIVIGKDGKIAQINSKVTAAEDSKAVLETVEKLNK